MRPETLARSIWVIRQIIQNEGFTVKESKTRMAGPARQRRVTGLVLNEKRAGIGRKRYRELRSKIHRLCNKAPDEADASELNHLSGWLAFVKDVDEPRWKMLLTYIEGLNDKYPEAAISHLVCDR